MGSSSRWASCALRSASRASVTLASGALAGVSPTACTRPVSRSYSTCRLYPSTRRLRLLRSWRIWASSRLMRRSLATRRRRVGSPCFDGAFHQPTIQAVGDGPLPKGHQGAFAKRRFLAIQAIQYHLPARIHGGGLDHFVVGDPCVGLQERCQRPLGGWCRWATFRLVWRAGNSLRLEGV